jgi:hypothetical protein
MLCRCKHSFFRIAAMAAILTAAAFAQNPVPFQDGQQSGFQQAPQQAIDASGRRPSMRLLFAQTLAVAAQAMGSSLIVGIAQTLTGGLTSWLERRTRPRASANVGAAAPQQFQQPTQFFDAQTGQPVAPEPAFVQQSTAQPLESPTQPQPNSETPQITAQDAGTAASTTVDLFAGLAFEVHALASDGQAIPVNPATHEFRTGDRFVVFFRPTLPGRMEVYNVNATGQQTQIDLQDIAAGQLTRLGPYQFAAQTGDEQLKLLIVPCSTPALSVATRDIVNEAAPGGGSGQGLELKTCQPAVRSLNRIRTRDIRTRDIRQVAVEGQTGFALDPVTSQERATGNLAPREVSIVMRHR